MGKSLAERIAELPESERDKYLNDVDLEQLQWSWDFWARTEQQPPDNADWDIWMFLGGRGSGKTRAAAEWIRDEAKISGQGVLRFGLVARTSADVRDVLVEGESGIVNVCPPSERPLYEPSKRRLTWPNGNQATCFSADEPDQLRGPQFHASWADEAAAWRQIPDAAGLSAFDNLRIATRLGSHPRITVTTTPKRVPLMRNLLDEAKKGPHVVVSHGTTADNAGNLSRGYLDAIYGVYSGTRLSRQELEGLMLEDVEGALWTTDMIQNARVNAMPVGVPIRVVGVDPTVAERPGDECGIVVCASTSERDLFKRTAWVIDDASVKGPPDVWANAVVRTARRWSAPIVVETNQGGALVRNALSAIDPSIPIYEVHSKFNKHLRAEPVVLAYEQGRVHHLGILAELEDQLTMWEPGSKNAPDDRIDALVHALTALLIKPPPGLVGGILRAHSPAARRIPSATTNGARSSGLRSARVFDPATFKRH